MKFKLLILWYYLGFRCQRRWYRGRWQVLRARRLAHLWKRLARAPFYQPFLTEKPVRLERFPIVDKKAYMENFDAIQTRGITRETAFEVAVRAEKSRDFSPMIGGVTVGLSSGTTGNKGLFLADVRERARWVAAVLDRVLGFSLRRRRVAFFLRADSNLYRSAGSALLEYHFFDLTRPVEENLRRLHDVQPDILVAQPSMLREIAAAVERGTITTAPARIIAVAEVLSPEDQARFTRVFGQTIHQVYQCTEGFLAATCEHGVLHFNEDMVIVEKKYLDAGRTRFHPVLTVLLRYSNPIVRYELNDIVVERATPCPCGSPWLAIERIEGRSDDVFTFVRPDGAPVRIFPDYFRRAIIMAHSAIDDYELVQTGPGALHLYIEPGADALWHAAAAALNELLNTYGLPDITIARKTTISRNLHHKFRKIRNETPISYPDPGQREIPPARG